VTASLDVTIDAVDADAAAAFWSEALGYRLLYVRGPYTVLGPPEGDPRPRVVIQRVDPVGFVETADAAKTPVHLDLRVDDPRAEVERLRGLGAEVAWEIDETAEGSIAWTVMTDPQGTHFCVCPART
jgi:predicted enzyme related to lactoylglutathione lyase